MAGMSTTNGQSGVSIYTHRNRILESKYGQKLSSLSVFPSRGKPILCIDLNRKFRVINSRMMVKALLKVGSDGRPVGGELLGKEIEFKPSFDEYLKVMESVRTTVRTVKDKTHVNGSRKQKLKGNLKHSKGSRAPLLEEKVDNVRLMESKEQFDQDKALEILENDELSQSVDEAIEKVGKTSKEVKGFDTEERYLHNNIKKQAGYKMDRRWLRYKNGGEKVQLEDLKLRESITNKNAQASTELMAPFKNNDYHLNKDPSSFLMLEKKGIQHKFVLDEKANDKCYALKQRKLISHGRTFSERMEHNGLKVERAAFRNFDEFNDIMDKPRVSQREMEERIQKLAKCLNGSDIDTPEWMFSKMMRSAKIKFTDYSILRVIQVLGKLKNWRRVLQVIEWLQMRPRFKSYKLRYIYTTALDVLGKARRPVEALNVFHAMLQDMSSYPDIVAFHSIAVTLGQAGHMKELFDIIDTMRSPPKKKFKKGALEKWDPRLEPDIVVYNAILNACVQRKQWEGTFWVLQQFKEQSLQPSTTTYGLVMEVMYTCGKYNLVHEFFRKLQKSTIPNALTYRVLVNTLWREGKIDEAVMAVQEMERRGVVGSAALYYDFARCLCSAGRCEDALMQIQKICKVANKPLVVTYTGLIQACLNSGNIQDGEYIFNQMSDFCSPNVVTCNIMLQAYVRHGLLKKAKELFEKMLQDGNHIGSKSDYKSHVIPDLHTFNTLLNAYFAEKRWDDFEYVYTQMLDHGYHFNAKRHLPMILNASKAGKEILVDTTWSHLTKAGQVLPPPLIKVRFCMKMEKDNWNAALSCLLNQNLGESQTFSKMAWLKLFKENSERFQKFTILRLINEVKVLIVGRNYPNPVLDNLLASCEDCFKTLRDK